MCWNHSPDNASRRSTAASRAGRARHDQEVRLLKEEIKSLIGRVDSGDVDRNNAAVMLQGYRTLQVYIETERKIQEQDVLVHEIEELKREHGKSA